MPDDPTVPAQPESAGPTNKKKAAPVNLAMLEAEKRGLDLSVPKPEPKAKRAPAEPNPAHMVPPPPAPAEEETAPAAAPVSEMPEAPVETASSADTPVETASAGQRGEPRENRGDRDNRGERGGRREDRRGDRQPERRPEPADETPLPTEPEAIRAELSALADQSAKGRLSPREEDRATADLRACLAGGDLTPAFIAMPRLPWILGVRAIEQAWPGLAPEGRTALLAGLAELPGDYDVRLGLSVARSLLRLDPAVGLQLAGAVCQAMWDAEKGALSAEHSKLVGNVFIGRGKPWVLQLPLANLAPEHADAIASCVVFSAFNVNNPPITQLSILRYAGDRLAGLHPNLLALVARNVGRWGGRWQGALRKEIPNLPEPLAAALKPGDQRKPEPSPAGRREGETAQPVEAPELPAPAELEEKLKLATESGEAEAVAAVETEIAAWRAAQRPAAPQEAPGGEADDEEKRRRGRRGRERERDSRDRNENRERERERPDNRERERSEKKERPAYVSREQEAKGVAPFNLGQSLRQIENYVQQLRNELNAAQLKARKVETSRKSPDRVVLSVEESNLSPEELKRLVIQLEQRNGELATCVEELLADSEARALATAADNDITEQYRALLKIKLQEDYNDYLALEKNSPEYVVQQHYRALIRHVFGTLREEGVALKGDLPAPPPPPMPPPPPPPVIEEEEAEEASPLDALDAEVDPAAALEAADAELPAEDEAVEESATDEVAPEGELAEDDSVSTEDHEDRPPDDEEVPEEPGSPHPDDAPSAEQDGGKIA